MGSFEAVCGRIYGGKLRFEAGDEQFREPFRVLAVAELAPAAQFHPEGVPVVTKIDLDLNLFHAVIESGPLSTVPAGKLAVANASRRMPVARFEACGRYLKARKALNSL